MAPRILLVDDDKDYLLAAKLTLEAEEYDVVTADSARQASEELTKQKPDLVLLDVRMPEKDGLTFCDELATNPDYAGIPVILVTAVAENPGMMMYAFEENYALSAKEIVPKTSAQKDLAGTVRRCLGEQE
jgi:CheY-like chemotaxis protein